MAAMGRRLKFVGPRLHFEDIQTACHVADVPERRRERIKAAPEPGDALIRFLDEGDYFFEGKAALIRFLTIIGRPDLIEDSPNPHDIALDSASEYIAEHAASMGNDLCRLMRCLGLSGENMDTALALHPSNLRGYVLECFDIWRCKLERKGRRPSDADIKNALRLVGYNSLADRMNT